MYTFLLVLAIYYIVMPLFVSAIAAPSNPNALKLGFKDINGDLYDKEVNLTLEIDEDMNVSGQIGNATIEDGKLNSNRNWLNIKSDYIIEFGYIIGKIDNNDVEDDRKFTLPFDLIDSKIDGSIYIIYDWQNPQVLCEVAMKKQ